MIDLRSALLLIFIPRPLVARLPSRLLTFDELTGSSLVVGDWRVVRFEFSHLTVRFLFLPHSVWSCAFRLDFSCLTWWFSPVDVFDGFDKWSYEGVLLSIRCLNSGQTLSEVAFLFRSVISFLLARVLSRRGCLDRIFCFLSLVFCLFVWSTVFSFCRLSSVFSS